MPLRWRGVRGTNSNSHDRRRVCAVGVPLEFGAVGETRTRIEALSQAACKEPTPSHGARPDQSGRGKPCRAPAVRGYQVCRMHGARGGAPEGKRNGNYRHGARHKGNHQPF